MLRPDAYQKYVNLCSNYIEEGRISESIPRASQLFTKKAKSQLFDNNFGGNSLCIVELYPIKQELIRCHTFPMATAMKGIYKGFKYTISQFFVVKEREIEIGYPTDVKHVAHIGWDGSSGAAPSWMSEFKTGPDFAATSIGNSGSALSPWSSQDFGESMRQHSGSEMFRDIPSSERKKQNRKKSKSTSSQKSTSGSSSRSARAAAKSNTKFVEGPTNIEVA